MSLFAAPFARPSRRPSEEVCYFDGEWWGCCSAPICATNIHPANVTRVLLCLCLAVEKLLREGSEQLAVLSSGLERLYPEDLLQVLFKALLSRTKIDPRVIEDVCIGTGCYVVDDARCLSGSSFSLLFVLILLPSFLSARHCDQGTSFSLARGPLVLALPLSSAGSPKPQQSTQSTDSAAAACRQLPPLQVKVPGGS